MAIHITGDIHGNITRILEYSKEQRLNSSDIVVILGDVGFNYYLNERDYMLKLKASQTDFKWFCIKGNHEKDPANLDEYKLINIHG